MSHVVEVDAAGVRVPLARRRVAEIARAVLRAEKVRRARLSIAFVDDARIARLNRRHLGHSGPTDVISFALSDDASEGLVGDIYIAPAVARRNAMEQGIPARDELTRLVVHGVLHVVGYDHPEGAPRYESAMWARQEQLLRALVRRTSRRVARSRSAA
jgi:probable rRNA maturation factor